MKKGDVFRNIFYVILGGSLAAAALDFLLIPAGVAPGGISGLSSAICDVFKIPLSVGTLIFILNVPLFVGGYLYIGRNFAAQSLIGTFVFSIMTNIFAPFTGRMTGFLYGEIAEPDKIICALWGGAILGAGLGFVFKGGATTGGSDMLGKLLHKKMSFISVGMFVCIVDALVILASAFVFETSNALYALISVVIMNYLLDLTLEGPDSARAYFIISEKSDAIAQIILREMERGVTGLSGRGMYSGTERNVLLCVVNRMESIRLRQIVMSVDEKAFVIATNVHEALGEGFKQY